MALRDDLLQFRVLDPACGSGNFLYVAFRELKRLEIELIGKASALFTPRALRDAGFAKTSRVSVRQMYGLDNSAFAVELARVTLTIAKELAKRDARETADAEEADLTGLMFDDALPLDDLSDTIRCADALFTEWPDADAVIGNPPFVAKNNMQPELGAAYVDRLRRAYPDVPGRADYCVYWFRKAHDHLGPGERAGLVGTNTIRQNYSREGGLDYVVQHGGTLTEAVSSQPWTGEAAVYVSIANWIKGDAPGPKRLFFQRDAGPREEMEVYELDRIGPALSPEADVTGADDLAVNKAADACYQGQTHGHAGFLLTPAEARAMIAADPKNRDVLFPFMTGNDLLTTNPPRAKRYVIDFHPRDRFEAQTYAEPFAQVKRTVLPDREEKAEAEQKRNEEKQKANPDARVNRHHANFLNTWWHLSYARGEMKG
jgi:type II restriction/modification system DNA methylase subunit YeeA